MSEFKPEDLSNIAWAFATARYAAPALFDAIGTEAARRVGEFNPQGLANTAWAFATAGHPAPAFFDAICTESIGRVREFEPQELKDTVLAIAMAGHAAPALLDAIAEESARQLREFKPQELNDIKLAFAKAGYAASALHDAIAADFERRRVRVCKPQELSVQVEARATPSPVASARDSTASATALLAVIEVRGIGLKREEQLRTVGITRAKQLAQLSGGDLARTAASAGISLKVLAACVLDARRLMEE